MVTEGIGRPLPGSGISAAVGGNSGAFIHDTSSVSSMSSSFKPNTNIQRNES